MSAFQAWVLLWRREQSRNKRLQMALHKCQCIQLRAAWCGWRDTLRLKRQHLAQAKRFRRHHLL